MVLGKSATYLPQKLIPWQLETKKCKFLPQKLTYLGWETSIKYLGGNQIETTFKPTYKHRHRDTHAHAHTQTHKHSKTRNRAYS